MDIYARKIISFLRNNMNLDLEIPDIAFHLKLDEQFVQNYLSSLLRQGLVTTKRNEYGRIYWYAIVPIEITPENTATIEFEPVEIEELTTKPVAKEKDNETEFDDLIEKKSKFPVKLVIGMMFTVGLVIGSAYITRIQLNQKIEQSVSVNNKNFVTLKEFVSQKDSVVSHVNLLKIEISGLLSTIDSLKSVITSMQKVDSTLQVKQVVESKPVVTKKVQKKRK